MSSGLANGVLDRLVDSVVGREPVADVMFERARELSVLPTVYQWAKRRDIPRSSFVEGCWREHVLRTRLYLREVLDVASSLEDVDHVVFKGLPLAISAHGDLRARSTGDADILVAAENLERATDRLLHLGFERTSAPPELSRHNQLELVRDNLVVEIHWALALPPVPTPGASDLLRRRIRVPLEPNACLWGLDPDAELLALCLHFHHHTGFLKGLFDIAAWLDLHPEGPGTWFWDTTRRLGLLGLVAWPLTVLSRLTLLPVPKELGQISASVGIWSQLETRAVRGALSRSTPYRGPELVSFKTFGTPAGYRMLLRMLSMSLLDGPVQRMSAGLYPVFDGPRLPSESGVFGSARMAGRVLVRGLLRVERGIRELRE